MFFFPLPMFGNSVFMYVGRHRLGTHCSRRQRLISMNNIGTPARMYKYVKRKLLNYSLLGARENFKDQHFSPPTKLPQSTRITSKSSPKLQRWWTKKYLRSSYPDRFLQVKIFDCSKIFFQKYFLSAIEWVCLQGFPQSHLVWINASSLS